MRQARGFWRANGAKGLLPFGEVCSSAELPSRPGTLPRYDVARSARCRLTFLGVGPFILRVGLFIDRLETCLRGKRHSLAKSIFGWWAQRSPAIYLPSDTALL